MIIVAIVIVVIRINVSEFTIGNNSGRTVALCEFAGLSGMRRQSTFIDVVSTERKLTDPPISNARHSIHDSHLRKACCIEPFSDGCWAVAILTQINASDAYKKGMNGVAYRTVKSPKASRTTSAVIALDQMEPAAPT